MPPWYRVSGPYQAGVLGHSLAGFWGVFFFFFPLLTECSNVSLADFPRGRKQVAGGDSLGICEDHTHSSWSPCMSLDRLTLSQSPHFLVVSNVPLLDCGFPFLSSETFCVHSSSSPSSLLCFSSSPSHFSFPCVLLGVEPRASHMLGKNSIQPFGTWVFSIPPLAPFFLTSHLFYFRIFVFSLEPSIRSPFPVSIGPTLGPTFPPLLFSPLTTWPAPVFPP